MTLICDVCRKSNRRLLETFRQENRAICEKCATTPCEKLGHDECGMRHVSEAYKKWRLKNNEIVRGHSQRINDMNSW